MNNTMTKFVLYVSYDEVLVTTEELEQAAIKQWFDEYSGRDLDDYDRKQTLPGETAVRITSRIKAL